MHSSVGLSVNKFARKYYDEISFDFLKEWALGLHLGDNLSLIFARFLSFSVISSVVIYLLSNEDEVRRYQYNSQDLGQSAVETYGLSCTESV